MVEVVERSDCVFRVLSARREGAMRVAIGADHRGFSTRLKVIDLLRRLGHDVDDLGISKEEPVDYPDIAALVAGKISRGEADRGLLMGGTGLGMCIAANKFPGVRAATCHDDLTTEISRRHNDLNVLCMSADMLGERLIERMVEIFLTAPFDGGRHARRIEKIAAFERGRQGQPPTESGHE
jgi:ribose 5-phosphate isomerase B